jgi:hypothetical protein
MFYLDMYDEESKCYTPYNFLYFSGFESRYNELTELYEVNGLINGAITIASFEDEELAVALTRSLFTLKAIAEINPQPEARFIDVDMIIDELEEMEEDDEEDDEVLITDETEEKIEEIAYCNVAYKFICIFIGFVIGVLLKGVFL